MTHFKSIDPATGETVWEGTAASAAALGTGPQPPSTVAFLFDVPDSRRRDPMNYYSTIKALVDGLVDAGLWSDDTPEFVTTVEPVLRNVGRKPQRVAIVIEAR